MPPSFTVRWLAAASLVAAGAVSAPACASIVTTIQVGSGGSLSTVQIDFTNGNGYLLEYRYDGAATSFSALQAFDAALPEFTLEWVDFGFGPLVVGLGVLGDYEYGTGDQWPVIENYWHSWIKDSGAWEWAPVGAGDRALFDGSADAWVFGTPAEPQPVPAPGAGIMVVVGALGSMRRRRHSA